MEVFPKDVMVPKNAIQAEFMHYPRQQDTAIRLLISMSNVGECSYLSDIYLHHLCSTSIASWLYIFQNLKYDQ